MPRLLLHTCCMSAAMSLVLVATHARAQTVPSRAEMAPVPGVRIGYERLGAADDPTPPSRFDGSVATPAGTLRTTVRAEPHDERRFQRGDTTFELPSKVFGGQVQLRELEAGGTAAAWSAQLGALTARTEDERTPVRKSQQLELRQALGDGSSAQALVSNARTDLTQGSRWDLELTRSTSITRWTAAVDAAERGYVSSSGGLEPRAGMRLGTEWRVLPRARLEARYTHQLRWDVEQPWSSVMVGTRFDLARRASLATGVETDSDANHKASVTLTVPLEAR
ncbi:hypothetical protein ACPWT1_19690 [Ramlibacter sp. MMS24-I3-19]|uniref:hypothetical protein n=1 Tax=Ramlibacter sp. MMS24-I3-19 TaxID=3416606 RepID=UPI003D05043C